MWIPATKLVDYAKDKLLAINSDKTKVMLFNSRKIFDLQPSISLSAEGEPLEVVSSYKLLGVLITNTLSWEENILMTTAKAYKWMWRIRKLKNMGAGHDLLLLAYKQQVRVFLDQNTPVWNGSLRQVDISQLERVQKTFCHVVLGDDYTTYEAVPTVCQKDVDPSRLR